MLRQEPPCSQGLGPCWARRREDPGVRRGQWWKGEEARVAGKVWGPCLWLMRSKWGKRLWL